jgi:methenyltetrahydromethanopterin cyclohydrolase
MVGEAHMAGKKVMVHAIEPEGIKNALIAGADTIEHGVMLDEEACKIMVEKKAFYVPTLCSEYIASKCKISPENLYLVMAPTASVAGSVQVSAHVLEDSLWRLTDYLDYEYSKVKYITGSSPISPVYPEIWRRPGITPDDMIRNAGRIHFYVYSSEGDDLQKIADEMIIEKTQAFGKPFFEILNSGIFSKGLDKKTLGREGWTYVIAEAMVTDLRTGKVFKAGKIHADLIRKFMGI